MLIVDAHLDLAMNALEWNRDLTRPIEEIRVARADPHRQARSRQGARSRSRRCGAAASDSAWRRRSRATWRRTTRCLAGIHRTRPGPRRRDSWRGIGRWRSAASWTPIRDRRRWTSTWRWSGASGADGPIGYVLSLEGADSIVTPRISSAPTPGPARRRPGALRPGRLRPGHERQRRDGPRGPRAAARDGAARASSSTRRTSATTASATRSITSAGRCGPATRTAARWSRTTASSPTITSAS